MQRIFSIAIIFLPALAQAQPNGSILSSWSSLEIFLAGIGALVALVLMVQTIALYDSTAGLIKLESEGAEAYKRFQQRRTWRMALRYAGFIGATLLAIVGLMNIPTWAGTAEDISNANAEAETEVPPPAPIIDETTVTMLTDEQSLAIGQSIFNSSCASCHGPKGEGGVGPMLTDEEWIHGGTITDVFTTIRDGVPEKGMIAWESQLSAKNIQQVASYILQMEGSAGAPLSSID